MSNSTEDNKIAEILEIYRKETEDLWDMFMEGDDPDPEKYDKFLDNAITEAKRAIEAYKDNAVREAIKQLVNKTGKTVAVTKEEVNEKPTLKDVVDGTPKGMQAALKINELYISAEIMHEAGRQQNRQYYQRIRKDDK